MARTKQNWLIVTERLKVVRGVNGWPRIWKHSTMIHLFNDLDLITDLQSTNRSQRHAVAESAELSAIYRDGKAVLATKNVDQKELATDDGIGQGVGVHDMGLLLAPGAVYTGISNDHIVPKIA